MGLIQLLDDNLINKIAAGEVVERPASVVKELVENCLDAGATRVTVELIEGGRKRILISDNGSGMDKADALLAIKRHATSKIRRDEDLFNLHTMGFRGEALASIAAVSRFTLMTCQQESTDGVRIVSEGGSEPDVSPWQSHGGTTIIVDDLFFNVPVRAKFLKSASTEYGNVVELMQSLALSWPQVDFTLVHNGREQLRAPAVATPQSAAVEAGAPCESELRSRFAQIFKSEAKTPMIYSSADGPYAQLTALLSAPGVEKATGRDIYIFVNGRLVRDKSIRFSILRGYHSHLLKGKFPVAVLFLKMDPGLVDVNVHPSKTEVRLQFASELQGMVAMAIRDAIRKAAWSGSEDLASALTSPLQDREPIDSAPFSGFPASSGGKSWFSGRAGYAAQGGGASALVDVEPQTRPEMRQGSAASAAWDLPRSSKHAVSPPEGAPQEVIPWDELHFMGAVADCYLLFNHGERKSGSRLLAVDQHAFHERILYERLCNNADLLRSTQKLLVPEVLTFTARDVSALVACQTTMAQNGFTFEVMDETTIELKAVPTLLAKADPEAMMAAFIRSHEAESLVPLDNNRGLAHDLLATMACHAAVRAGEPLGDNELKALLAEARSVDFFHNCPHGRRVFRWWDEAQIGRWFDR